MVNFNSPGVYVIEKDQSDFAPTIDSSIVGIVGFANKGPVNKATLITSPQNLIDNFGQPDQSIPGQGLEGAVEILETTNQVYYVRAVSGTAANASATVQMGGCPAVLVSANGFGVSSNITFDIQVTDELGVNQYTTAKQFDITSALAGAASGSQAQALKAVLGGSLDSDKVGVHFDGTNDTSGYIVGSFAGSGASMTITAYTNSSKTTGLNAFQAVNGLGVASPTLTSSTTVIGTTIKSTGPSSLGYVVESLYPGTGYNASTNAAGNTIGNSVEINTLGGPAMRLQVNEDGAVEEEFKISLLASGAFVEDVINTGLANAVSEIVQGNLVSGTADYTPTALQLFTNHLSALGGFDNILGAGQGISGEDEVNPRFAKFLGGTYNLAAGTNGYSTDSSENATIIIGDATTNPKEGMQVLDDDSLNISIAVIPGIYDQSVQNNLITLAENSQNFIALVAPAQGTIDTAQEAIDWSNGQAESRTAALNSSWAACYFPHVKVFSVFDGVDIWYDPTIFAARQMAFTDNVAEAWFAPAGFQRGRLTKPTEVEVVLNQGDRDSLYSGGNVVNPLVNFAQRGITIFGQRTTQRDPTALDRINVRRLMILLRKTLLNSTQRFVFEPNDSILWEKVKATLDPVLADIQNRRGITEYKVVCDETTNTPARIENNQLWCKILLKPTKTAEVLVFELNVTNQSAKIGN